MNNSEVTIEYSINLSRLYICFSKTFAERYKMKMVQSQWPFYPSNWSNQKHLLLVGVDEFFNFIKMFNLNASI